MGWLAGMLDTARVAEPAEVGPPEPVVVECITGLVIGLEPPEISADLRLRLIEDHLRLLAWSLREGRPLPPVPAALRGPRRAPS